MRNGLLIEVLARAIRQLMEIGGIQILIMVNDVFDVFLDSVCEYFIEYFCISLHKGNWSEILFIC